MCYVGTYSLRWERLKGMVNTGKQRDPAASPVGAFPSMADFGGSLHSHYAKQFVLRQTLWLSVSVLSLIGC